jgi:transcription antitermination factor NusG
MYSSTNIPITANLGAVQVLPTEPHWYAIYTRSRFEKKVQESLERAGYHVFLPMVKEKRLWSDRLKTVVIPLLPGYLFIKTAIPDLRQVLYYPGVVRIISCQGKPCEVRTSDINLLEMIVTHGYPVEHSVKCCVGDQVRVIRGPLKGWEGKVSRSHGPNKVMFQFESIGQVISVEVGAGEVERV